ncbi:glycosyltransferase [Jatrophihabitans endophyticus]|uniref:glycosyltransferase n=1 Tax=Jatrophihabitans endophyticus TaxID=1206085 RepID=UPI001A085934|nr:glycosyltransferase [Jatrophihabitans endophyticus]MBE7187230.1 glycosyltransferase [Jatrophihabitans endophyticus]
MSGSTLLQRVILPGDDDLDVVPLYVETDSERGAGTARESAGDRASARDVAAVGSPHSGVRFVEVGTGERPARAAVVDGDRRVSFATYFNAFPAGYWRRWTIVEQVTLRLRIVGAATVVVYRSTAKGTSHPVRSLPIDPSSQPGGPALEVAVDLPLRQFADGGWYWFDLVAGPDGATLLSAQWDATGSAARHETTHPGRVSIGITTFNRPTFLLDLLRQLGDAPDVLDLLDRVYVIDQGTDRVLEQLDFPAATKSLGDRLEVIEQPNLGGSGGFSRAMSETLDAGTSDYVLLLDDDVVLEPEGILRAVTFADLARRPSIVGGHMFSLYDRSVLHAFGETVAPYTWWWGAAPHTRAAHDFGRQGLRHTPWLHRRVDADYNGWWMCLVPTSVVRELGLALPVFIKWDDAEYGLRARRAGVPTVSMPGVAVWHVPWQDKTDAVDWQAYYHVRNRLVTALLHSPYEHGGRVVAESMETQIQHLLSMQYSTAAMRVLALEDLLSGPDHLHAGLATKNAQLAELRSRFVDAQGAGDVEAFPAVRRRKPPSRGREATSPTGKVGLVRKAALGGLRQLRPLPAGAGDRPVVALPHQDAAWWLLSNVDSALVSAADGASVAWYQRDPQAFRSLLARSSALHLRLLRDWRRISSSYRVAAGELTSPAQWRRTFGGSAGDQIRDSVTDSVTDSDARHPST